MENKEYVNFIKKLVEENKLEGDALKEANEMLEKNFREEVIDLFGGRYRGSYNCEEFRQKFYKIKESKTYKVDFLTSNHLPLYDYSKKEFLMENWDNFDKIIDVLDKYIQELEEEQKLEEEKEKQESNEGSEEVNND